MEASFHAHYDSLHHYACPVARVVRHCCAHADVSTQLYVLQESTPRASLQQSFPVTAPEPTPVSRGRQRQSSFCMDRTDLPHIPSSHPPTGTSLFMTSMPPLPPPLQCATAAAGTQCSIGGYNGQCVGGGSNLCQATGCNGVNQGAPCVLYYGGAGNCTAAGACQGPPPPLVQAPPPVCPIGEPRKHLQPEPALPLLRFGVGWSPYSGAALSQLFPCSAATLVLLPHYSAAPCKAYAVSDAQSGNKVPFTNPATNSTYWPAGNYQVRAHRHLCMHA